MPIRIIKSDITSLDCDIVVCPTDSRYSGSGGADSAIHSAAGAELDDECSRLPPLKGGQVCLTGGYRLCRNIIHVFGPEWADGRHGETDILRSCYIKALELAEDIGAQSIAFPLISAGRHGFPRDIVLRIAQSTISDHIFASDKELDITICLFDRSEYEIIDSEELNGYLSDNIRKRRNRRLSAADVMLAEPMITHECRSDLSPKAKTEMLFEDDACPAPESLDEWLKKNDESFALTLLRLIDRKGMTDVECYKRANVSRKTFSKLNTQSDYRPSKPTVIAFAIALELTLDETEQLLKTAGFTLSDSFIFDRIIKFYIINGVYDVFRINESLYKYDQVCLGA